jgi:CheY-like chemotaxis protein
VAKIRVVVADAHQEILASGRGTLGDDFELVAAVEDGNQALRAVLALDPDVLVTDISMPISGWDPSCKRDSEGQSPG